MKQNSWHNFYTPPDPNLWQGRLDVKPFEQLYQHIQCLHIDDLPSLQSATGFAIVGFCSDEGVRRNNGRVGAVEGPQAIRKVLGKLAAHFFHPISIFDLGNINCAGKHLEEAQQALGHVVEKLITRGLHPIILGGGHETAWGHYQGLRVDAPSSLGIINIDAHFDLRPLNKEFQGHSGTPFLQIAKDRKVQDLPFDYLCLGIQKTANTSSLFETAREWKVNYVEAEELYTQPDTSFAALDKFLLAHNAIYLSVCLDVLGIAFAPGVSAPQALGLTPWQVISLIQKIAQSGKVIGIDFVELSPRLDQDNKTALLAASLIMAYLKAVSL